MRYSRIGQGVGGDKVVRAAARLADSLDAPWHAVYVETPRLQRLAESKRRRILGTLKLAEMGAETTTVPGHDAADGLIEYARSRNISRLVVERPARALRWRRLLSAPLSDRLGYLAPDIDVVEVAQAENAKRPDRAAIEEETASSAAQPGAWRGYLWSAGACAVASADRVRNAFAGGSPPAPPPGSS